VKPDGETRVWLAAGNCLFGNVNHSPNSMCVTALSAYTCNQVVGYTVPSWYGEGGWGTLGTFFGNTAGTSLAEAWFLNNQFLLNRTQELEPKLMNVTFNGEQFSPSELSPSSCARISSLPKITSRTCSAWYMTAML
jgi:zinc protease